MRGEPQHAGKPTRMPGPLADRHGKRSSPLGGSTQPPLALAAPHTCQEAGKQGPPCEGSLTAQSPAQHTTTPHHLVEGWQQFDEACCPNGRGRHQQQRGAALGPLSAAKGLLPPAARSQALEPLLKAAGRRQGCHPLSCEAAALQRAGSRRLQPRRVR